MKGLRTWRRLLVQRLLLLGGLAAGAGAAVTSTEVATAVGFVAASAATGGTFAIVAGGLIGVGLLSMGVSMGLKAISTARSEYKGEPGHKIKQSQQNILTALDQRINDSKPATDSSSNNSGINQTLKHLKTAIKELGDPEAIRVPGRRSMGYPTAKLSKVIKALPTDQKDAVCTLLSKTLKLGDDFKALGITLSHPFSKTKQVDNGEDGPRQQFSEKEVTYPSKFELLETEYVNIESSILKRTQPKEAKDQILSILGKIKPTNTKDIQSLHSFKMAIQNLGDSNTIKSLKVTERESPEGIHAPITSITYCDIDGYSKEQLGPLETTVNSLALEFLTQGDDFNNLKGLLERIGMKSTGEGGFKFCLDPESDYIKGETLIKDLQHQKDLYNKSRQAKAQPVGLAPNSNREKKIDISKRFKRNEITLEQLKQEMESLNPSGRQPTFDDKNLFKLLEPYYNNTKQGPIGNDIITNANEKNRKAIQTMVEQIFKLKGCSISDGGVTFQGKRLTERMGRYGPI